jgi:hypothetical protein
VWSARRTCAVGAALGLLVAVTVLAAPPGALGAVARAVFLPLLGR